MLGGPSAALSQMSVRRRRFGSAVSKSHLLALFDSIAPPICDADPKFMNCKEPIFQESKPTTRNWTSQSLTVGTLEGSYKPGLAA